MRGPVVHISTTIMRNISIRLAALPLLLGAVLPRALAAQGADPMARVQAALPAAAAAEFAATVQDARSRGLPVEPLVDKALEGTAKGVAPDRILAVVRALEGDLGRARFLLGADRGLVASDVAGIADALRRGVPETALRTIAEADGRGSMTMEAHVLADLLEAGVPVEAALDVLSAWRGRGHDAEELRDLPAAVEGAMHSGKGPAQAAAEVAARVRSGRGPLSGRPPAPGVRGRAQGQGHGAGPPLPPGSDPPTKKAKKKHGGSGG